jgi:hypothetical protein
MNKVKNLIHLATAALAAVARIDRRTHYEFANIAEGTYETGCMSRLTDAAITRRHLVVAVGSTINHVALAGVTSIALGVVDDEAEAAEDPVNVQLLGNKPGTVLMVASAAITAGAQVVTAADGKIRTLPVATGTYHIIGRALEAANGDNDVINVQHCYPIQRIVA